MTGLLPSYAGIFGDAALLGLMVAAPVGPVSLLVLRRALLSGWRLAVVSGYGVALADASYALVAALALAAVTPWLTLYDTEFHLISAALIAWIGFDIWRKTKTSESVKLAAEHDDHPLAALSLGKAFWSCFGLTIVNPLTTLSFAALFGGYAVARDLTGGEGVHITLSLMLMVTGVFIGSALWWHAVAWFGDRLGRRLPAQGILWMNRASALAFLGFALWLLASALIEGAG